MGVKEPTAKGEADRTCAASKNHDRKVVSKATLLSFPLILVLIFPSSCPS